MSDYQQINGIIIENWSNVLNTILGKEVKIVVGSVESKKKEELMIAANDFSSFVSMSYAEDESKKIVLMLKDKFISIISNMMIGLDSFTEEITDDDKDAFVEATNQMFSTLQVPLKETLGMGVNFKNPTFMSMTEINEILNEEGYKIWDISVDLQDIAVEKFLMLAPESFLNAPEAKPVKEAVDKRPAHALETKAAPAKKKPVSATYADSNIDLLLDVELPINVRIGSTEMKLIDIMKLGLGSMIELDKRVDDPVEIYVNDILVARGEVVVFDSNFGVRILDVESREDRIKSLSS